MTLYQCLLDSELWHLNETLLWVSSWFHRACSGWEATLVSWGAFRNCRSHSALVCPLSQATLCCLGKVDVGHLLPVNFCEEEKLQYQKGLAHRLLLFQKFFLRINMFWSCTKKMLVIKNMHSLPKLLILVWICWPDNTSLLPNPGGLCLPFYIHSFFLNHNNSVWQGQCCCLH